MNFPLISEYIDAILSAEDNFNELTNLRPVLDDNGNPIMSSGNFAVVFKMQNIETGKFHAVKCFTRDQKDRDEAYKKITNQLKNIQSPYFVSFEYHRFELFVNSTQTNETEFPVVLMDWVEGITLDKFIEAYKGNPFVLYELCYNFRIFANWLLKQQFAHGDLKPDNILIKEDASIILIDYDGMYVPAMQGENPREEGTPEYKHPFKEYVFDEHIDDFALSVIALSLKLISISYGISEKFHPQNGLLFSVEDYLDINSSHLFSYIHELVINEPLLGLYYSTFIKCLSCNNLSKEDFNYPQEKDIDNLLQYWAEYLHVSNDDKITNGIVATNGIIYTKDRLFVIGYDDKVPYNEEDIFIEEGTIGICEDAFDYSTPKMKLHLPSTLRYFSSKSLNYRFSNLRWKSPWFSYKDGIIYTKDFTECILIHLKDINYDDAVEIFGNGLYSGINFDGIWPNNLKRIRKAAFKNSIVPNELHIPEGVIEISYEGFQSCSAVSVILPSTLERLGSRSFHMCENLQRIEFNQNSRLTTILDMTFCNNKKLRTIIFPKNLHIIGKSAFRWCGEIENLDFPQSLEELNDYAFEIEVENYRGDNGIEKRIQPSKISSLIFPPSLKKIGVSAFEGNSNLEYISFQSSVSLICRDAFKDCYNLKKVDYKEIGHISNGAFANCPKLYLYISDAIKEIMPGAITGATIECKGDSFEIINSALYSKSIQESYYSDSIKDRQLIYYWGNERILELPEGIRDLEESAFLNHPSTIVLPNSFDEKKIGTIKFVDTIVIPSFYMKPDYWEGPNLTYDKVYIDTFGVAYSSDKTKLLTFPSSLKITSYTVLQECTEICEKAFDGDEDYDPEFGSMSFYGNKLIDIILPSNLIKIDKAAFYGCRKLKSIILPESIKHIGTYAFAGCISLKEIIIKGNIETIGEEAFPISIKNIVCESKSMCIHGGCLLKNERLLWMPYDIFDLHLPKNIIYREEECLTFKNCIISKRGKLMWTSPNIKSFKFPPNTIEIDKAAFIHNNVITHLYIPEGVIEIDFGFGCNDKLTDIYLPSSLKKIGNLRTHHGYKGKYVWAYYPKHIHIPKGMRKHILDLLPDLDEDKLIEDYDTTFVGLY